MMLKIALLFLFVASSSCEDANEKVQISVFYESQCGDSIKFFKRQVKQAYDALNQYIDFEFVPYGKAMIREKCISLLKKSFISLMIRGLSLEVKCIPPVSPVKHEQQNETIRFTCHHGATECEYNKVQSCAIKYSLDQNKTVSFLSCVMSTYRQNSALESCAKQSSLNLEKINECTTGQEGDVLMAKHGDRTNNFQPSITYVPTIVLNGVYDSTTQYDAEFNLLETVCKKLKNKPDACKKS